MSDEMQAMYRTDLCAFSERAHLEIEPETVLHMNWHHEVIALKLEQCSRREIKRLIVNQPPKTMKTFLIAVAYVAFTLGRRPGTKVLIVSYDDDLSIKQVRAVRTIIKSKWFQCPSRKKLSRQSRL